MFTAGVSPASCVRAMWASSEAQSTVSGSEMGQKDGRHPGYGPTGQYLHQASTQPTLGRVFILYSCTVSWPQIIFMLNIRLSSCFAVLATGGRHVDPRASVRGRQAT